MQNWSPGIWVDAIIPSIEGWARVTGFNTITIDDRDPFAHGFQVVDRCGFVVANVRGAREAAATLQEAGCPIWVVVIGRPAFGSGRTAWASRAAMVVNCVCAWATVTPGLSRPIS